WGTPVEEARIGFGVRTRYLIWFGVSEQFLAVKHPIDPPGADGLPAFSDELFAGSVVVAGWPMEALSSFDRLTPVDPARLPIPVDSVRWPRSLDGGVAIPQLLTSQRNTDRRLPLRPLWMGFFVNSVLFSMVPFSFFLVLAHQKRARAARG